VKRSATLQGYAAGLRTIPVPEKLDVNEAASLFEVWMRYRAVPGGAFCSQTISLFTGLFTKPHLILVAENVQSASDSVFLAKYAESNGNARDFVQKGLLSSLAYA
jgi:small subunit ribosomal protein S29